MVFDRHAAEGGTRSTSIRAVSEALGVGAETLRNWCQRSSLAPAVVSSNSTETPEEQIKRLQRELAEARRANEILRKASAFFVSGTRDAPTTR